MDSTFSFTHIGIIRSCFREKFGIPRQPRLVPAAHATLEILPPYDQDEAFRELTAFSHLWIVFVFHGIGKETWRPTVRPPRLGGNRRIGVFSTRSGFRPNPIGISAVTLQRVHRRHGRLCLELSGIDLLDRTPVLDIKPYLPYTDSIPTATGGFAADPPCPEMVVHFSDSAQKACLRLETEHPGLFDLIIQVLAADPRPATVKGRSGRNDFGIRLYDLNIRWTVIEGTILVQDISPFADSSV